jgi:hypothetical protein
MLMITCSGDPLMDLSKSSAERTSSWQWLTVPFMLLSDLLTKICSSSNSSSFTGYAQKIFGKKQ